MVERLGEMRKRRRERIEKGSRERIEKERKERKEKAELRRQFEEEEEEEYHHLPLLVVQLPQGTAVLLRRYNLQTRFCSKALQQCSIDPENEVVGVAKWQIIRTIWFINVAETAE